VRDTAHFKAPRKANARAYANMYAFASTPRVLESTLMVPYQHPHETLSRPHHHRGMKPPSTCSYRMKEWGVTEVTAVASELERKQYPARLYGINASNAPWRTVS